MAVAIESFGYPAVFDEVGEVISGAIDAKVGATYWPALAAGRYSVEGPNDWKVSSQVGIDRGIRIESGTVVGDAIMDRLPLHDTFSLPAVGTGTRWFLVVARRSWSAPAITKVHFIEGPTGDAEPTELPILRDPGFTSDQPVAYCMVDSKSTVITRIIDLRVIGGSEIFHKLALRYLEDPAQPVKLGSALWVFERLDALGNWGHSQYQLQKEVLIRRHYQVSETSNENGEVDFFFPSFPTRLDGTPILTDNTFGESPLIGYRHVLSSNTSTRAGQGYVRYRTYNGTDGLVRKRAAGTPADKPGPGHTVNITLFGY